MLSLTMAACRGELQKFWNSRISSVSAIGSVSPGLPVLYGGSSVASTRPTKALMRPKGMMMARVAGGAVAGR